MTAGPWPASAETALRAGSRKRGGSRSFQLSDGAGQLSDGAGQLGKSAG
ncbi:MAG: hypothetical protein E5X83_20145 [Mesorhizobium sp.]|nr:MAG: hypothetical protein EOR57_01385 [Mesorhizobium sp.]RWM69091.1 MAG: hypothetical protein EOR82_24265 [Mesorhizobium sp.]TIO23871.1 MAG: hypothetical protein E5X83_20145 [Mesorhizobium sp.]TJV59705.1 MAG: hypothetical protein E5X82_15345 [Mesorhizobium sp.]